MEPTTTTTPARYPEIGTISAGTMRSEDLIPAFMSVLREYAPITYDTLADDEPEALEDDDYPDAEAASYFLDDLFAALEAIAPPFCYFGANEGDGADFGFWPALDSLEESARYADGVIKVSDGDDWSHADTHALDYVMSVSDHGNVTLYDARTRAVIWSIV